MWSSVTVSCLHHGLSNFNSVTCILYAIISSDVARRLCVPHLHVHGPRNILRPVCHAGVHQGRHAVAVDAVRREALGQQDLQWLFGFANGCIMHLEGPLQPRGQIAQTVKIVKIQSCLPSLPFFACLNMMYLIKPVKSWTKGGKREACWVAYLLAPRAKQAFWEK